MSRTVTIPAAFVVAASLCGLAACDPGYEFTIHNRCDASMKVDLRDSDEFDQSGSGGAVTIEPHSTASWTLVDAHINPPFGLLLLNGPRAGDHIKSDEPNVTIPESACPR